MKRADTQVVKQHYALDKYLDRARWRSDREQIASVTTIEHCSVLCIEAFAMTVGIAA